MNLIAFAETSNDYAQEKLLQIAAERNHPNNKKYLRTISPTHPDNQLDWFKKVIADKSCAYFFIYDSEVEGVIGYCGLDKIDYINRTAEISICIFSAYQKKGYGIQAVKRLLLYGFYTFGLNCIFAESYLYPEREEFIGKFWKNAGFTLEGILRQRKFWDGNYYDSGLFSIIKGE